MFGIYKISLRHYCLAGTSCAVMTALMACAPIQVQTESYEARPNYAAAQSTGHHGVLPAYKRYGFSPHNLGSYDLGDYDIKPAQEKNRQQPIQKFASAEDLRLSPYVPPSQGTLSQSALRFAPPSLDVHAAPDISPNGAPTLRPRFEHHLDGDFHSSALINQRVQLPPDPAIETRIADIAPAQKVISAPNPALGESAQTKPVINPVINKAEFDEALKARRADIGSFEAGPARPADLPIPPLPEDQKETIRKEQAALSGIASKSVLAGSDSLRQSLDSAFARSSRLAAENLRVDEAEEVLKQAKAQSRPRLEFRSAVGPRQSETTFAFSNTTVSATSLRRSAELDLSLPIYQGGRLRVQRASAKIGIETARAAVSQTRSEIIEQTALAYLDVVRDRELVDLYQKNVDLLTQQQSSTAELLALDESTISEKALIDARLAAQRIRLETGRGILRESETHYRNLTGKKAAQHLPVPIFNLPLSLVEIQALAQQNNPELTALINRAKSAELEIDLAKSGNRPSLALQGLLRGAEGQSETIDRNAAAELLLNLRVPISSGGEGRSRVRQAKIVRNRLNLEIRDRQDTIRDQIDGLWARKVASEKSQSFNQTQIEATEFAVNAVAEQRSEGVATILDLLNVQQSLLDAKIQTVQARSRQDTASVQLLNFMGVYQ